MKSLLTGVLALGLLVGPVMAEEFPGNPDRFPSVGLDYTQSQIDVTGPLESFYDSTDGSTAYMQLRSTVISQVAVIDMRVPVSNNVTFTVHGGPLRNSSFGESHTGYSLGGGFRIYIK